MDLIARPSFNPVISLNSPALTINFSGYFAEILRSGFESTPKGQLEAASALNLNRYGILKNDDHLRFNVSTYQVVKKNQENAITPTVLQFTRDWNNSKFPSGVYCQVGNQPIKKYFPTMGRFIACRKSVESAIQLATSVEHNLKDQNPWRHEAYFEVIRIEFNAQHIRRDMQREWWEKTFTENGMSLRINAKTFELIGSNGVQNTSWSTWTRGGNTPSRIAVTANDDNKISNDVNEKYTKFEKDAAVLRRNSSRVPPLV